MGRLADWLEERAGHRALIRGALHEPVPGGARLAYVFGSVLVFVLLLQLVTGVFLAMYYSPSATDAWASVAYIQDQVTLGWLVRGLHHHGASAMVIVCGLHLLQTAVYGAYKKPRELNWIIGCLMLALVLAFALTGYLLPWDQTGYWATKVATGIAGSTPLIGVPLQEALQGGNEYGNLTLTRFFALHVFILPGALIGLLVFHVYLFRRHGVTPRWGRSAEELERSKGWFWPDQMIRDLAAGVVALAAMGAATLATDGARLDGPADPASNFDARPEWYFRALFEALKYFEGAAETAVALGAPLVIGGFLVGLPFLDRGPERDPRRRLIWLGLLGLLFAGGAALTAKSFAADAADEDHQEALASAEADAERARALAREYGVPVAGGTAVYDMEPDERPIARYAERGPIEAATMALWDEHCSKCHEGDKREAPELPVGYNSRTWIRDFLQDPDHPRFFGLTPIAKEKKKGRMKPVKLDRVDLDAVVEMLYAQTGAKDADAQLAARGRQLYDDGSCSDCHEIEPGTESDPGPNLAGRGTLAHLADLLADPGTALHYGEFSEMPAFRDEIGDAGRWALAEYLVWLRDQR